jgi:hypothetical protein
MALFGYYYESDGTTTFWVILLLSIGVGAWMGYNNYDED